MYVIKQASLEEDIPSLSLLERLSFSPDNWTPFDFRTLLSPSALADNYHTFLLISPSAQPISYLSAHLLPCGFLDLLSLVTHPSHQRQGFASLLFLSYLSLIPPPSVISCSVRESNLPAQLFLKSLSFRCVGLTPPQHFPPEPYYLFELHS